MGRRGYRSSKVKTVNPKYMQPFKSHQLLTTVRLEFVLEYAVDETHTVKKSAPMMIPSLTCIPPQTAVTCVLLHPL